MKSALTRTGKLDSEIARHAQFLLARPTTGHVMSSMFKAGRDMPGSFEDAKEAAIISAETGQEPSGVLAGFMASLAGRALSTGAGETLARSGTPLTKEDWEDSDYSREGLKYQENETDLSAEIKARRHDFDQYSNFIAGQASLWQNAGGFAANVVGAMTDPVNLGLSLGLSSAGTPLAGAAFGVVNSARRGGLAAVSSVGRVRSSARAGVQTVAFSRGFIPATTRAAAEGAVAGGAIALSGLGLTDITGRDYGAEEAFVDFIAGTVLSAGFSATGSAVSKAWNRWRTPSEAADVVNTMQLQKETGQMVDIEPLLQAQMAGRFIPTSTLTRAERGNPTVVKDGKEFRAYYEGEQGRFVDVEGKGTTKKQAVAALNKAYDTPDKAAVEGLFGFPLPESYIPAMREYNTTVNDFNDFNIDKAAVEEAARRGVDTVRFEEAVAQRDNARAELAKAEKDIIEATQKGVEDTAGTQQEANAKAAVFKEAEDKLQQLKDSEQYKESVAAARNIEDSYKEGLQLMEKELLRMQNAPAIARLEQWAKRQTDTPLEERSASPEVRQAYKAGLPKEAIEDDMSKVVNDALADAEATIAFYADEPGVKEIVTAERAAIEKENVMSELLSDFIECIGKK